MNFLQFKKCKKRKYVNPTIQWTETSDGNIQVSHSLERLTISFICVTGQFVGVANVFRTADHTC